MLPNYHGSVADRIMQNQQNKNNNKTRDQHKTKTPNIINNKNYKHQICRDNMLQLFVGVVLYYLVFGVSGRNSELRKPTNHVELLVHHFRIYR
jgi:hypothetical protein